MTNLLDLGPNLGQVDVETFQHIGTDASIFLDEPNCGRKKY